jgi:arabinose-5-phosphate isomerase
MSDERDHGLDADAAGREVVERAGTNVSSVAEQLDERFVAVVRLISGAGGKVVTIGAGTSGLMAHRMAHILSVAGTPRSSSTPAMGYTVALVL